MEKVDSMGFVVAALGHLQRGGRHPAGALADDPVDQGAGRDTAVGVHYGQHGRVFPSRARSTPPSHARRHHRSFACPPTFAEVVAQVACAVYTCRLAEACAKEDADADSGCRETY
ncbi:hypothetical protein ACVW0K_000197 [Streptomyces filamentosus]